MRVATECVVVVEEVSGFDVVSEVMVSSDDVWDCARANDVVCADSACGDVARDCVSAIALQGTNATSLHKTSHNFPIGCHVNVQLSLLDLDFAGATARSLSLPLEALESFLAR